MIIVNTFIIVIVMLMIAKLIVLSYMTFLIASESKRTKNAIAELKEDLIQIRQSLTSISENFKK